MIDKYFFRNNDVFIKYVFLIFNIIKNILYIMNYINNTLTNLNDSKYFLGIMMFLLNAGSKYALLEISPLQNVFFNNKVIRRCLLFSIFFIATRDIWVSFFLTAIFIVMAFELFNEQSKYCIIPKKILDISKYDINNDKKLSPEEIKYAYLDLRSKGFIT